RREHLDDQWASESADWVAPGYIPIVERGQRPLVVGLERERGLGPVERHRHAGMILCVDPATLLPGGDGFIHAADRLQFDVAASADAARLVADGPGCPQATPMARKTRKVGEQGPYRTRGRSHATLHPDVAFKHEDHSKRPASCRAGCRPHLMIAPADAAAQSADRG